MDDPRGPLDVPLQGAPAMRAAALGVDRQLATQAHAAQAQAHAAAAARARAAARERERHLLLLLR